MVRRSCGNAVKMVDQTHDHLVGINGMRAAELGHTVALCAHRLDQLAGL